jgi:hypothetical protein
MTRTTKDELSVERAQLEADRAKRIEQRAAVVADVADAERQCAASATRRQSVRLAALAEGDAEAARELDAATQAAAAAELRRQDLAAVVTDLDNKIAEIDERLRRNAYAAGFAELRAMQAERVALAAEFDAAVDRLSGLAERYQALALDMSRRAARLGIENARRFYDLQPPVGATLYRVAPDHMITRQLHKSYRQPLAVQLADFDRFLVDREPPDDWRPGTVTASEPPAPEPDEDETEETAAAEAVA